MEQEVIQSQPKRRVFTKAIILILGVVSTVGLAFVIYSRQVTNRVTVINGITVPPEPAPSLNNSTIAGIDVNKNGVRDDVERMIAKGSNNQAEFDNSLITAKAYQSILLAPSLTQAEHDAALLRITCADLKIIDGLGSMGSGKIKPATLNTSARKREYKAKIINISGRFTNAREECSPETIQTSEIINGITVPLEPDSTLNNSTLAGIDVNKNGVRDDVERVLAKELGSDKAKYAAALPLAIAEQALIVSPNEATKLAYTRLVSCTTVEAEDFDKVTYTLLNTPVRSNAYATALAGSSIGDCE